MSTSSPNRLYPERLQGVMISRVVLVTVFLSGALLFDTNTITDWSSARNVTLIILVVGTYLLTIIYALWFKRQTKLQALAITQVSFDLVLAFFLVLSTGGLRGSIFLFAMALPIIAAALVLGRTAALVSASIVSSMILLLSMLAIGLVPDPYGKERLVIQSIAYIQRVLFEGSIQVVMAYVLAGISGQLAKQLGEVKSELKQQQLDIQELRKLNENILASLNSGLMTITIDHQLIFFNRAAEQITGLSSANLFGKDLEEVFPRIAKRINDVNTLDTLNTERRFEERYTAPNGEEITLGFSASLLRNATDEIIGQIIIFQDLTAIKRLEYQAKRSEHMAAIGQLSAAIAHEIRNPLAAISGSVEMLQMMLKVDEDEATLMQIVVREVERLNDLITQFLEYSRPKALNLQATVLYTLITDVLVLFEHRAGDVEVALHIDEELKTKSIMIDPQAIQQVLWNLLNNAHEAMLDNPPEHERIIIELNQQTIEHIKHMVLSVEDHGPGIQPTQREQIFEPFFTTKTQGTGLGLATLYRIVENHGGFCRCDDPKHGEGARFTIALPINTIPYSGHQQGDAQS